MATSAVTSNLKSADAVIAVGQNWVNSITLFGTV